MENPFNKEDLIEAYIRQELTAEELKKFEADLAGDMDLQHEILMQRDIISAIKESRRLEFKAKLNAINVKTPFINTNYIIAGASGIAVIALISFYTLFESTEIHSIENEKLTTESIEASANEDLEEKISEDKSVSLEEEILFESKNESSIDLEVLDENVSESSMEIENLEDESQIIAKIVKPSIPGEDSNEGFSISELDSESTITSSGELRKVSKFDVEISTDNKYDFHYKFYNNKLYLYGDFSKSPYELLELNSNGKRDLYMYFDNKYYALDDNQLKITSLNVLKDKTIIKGLNNLR